MADEGPIWECAKRDLVSVGPDGVQDAFLWEHARRVARSAVLIVGLPGVRSATVDVAALEAAALYHDAGWALQLRDGTVSRSGLLARPGTSVQRELGAALLTESLADHLPARSLRRAARLIRNLHDKHARTTEARLLADADNLDEIGSLSLWITMRRNALEGRGIDATIATWNRQREFRFWEARLSRSFWFDAVRDVALARLGVLNQLVTQLAAHDAGQDLVQSSREAAPEAE